MDGINMDSFKALLVALPLIGVALWSVAGIFGARLAGRPALQRWSLPSRSFHWIMAFAILGTTAVMYYSQNAEGNAKSDPAARAEYVRLLTLHKSLGLVVLFLVLLRLAWNLYRRRPPLPAAMPEAQRRLALGAHHTLYALMFFIPLFGWFASMAYGGHTTFFGLFDMPQWLAKDVHASGNYRNLHIWLGWLLFALLAVHIGAALWHHFSKRDATLAQMLPWAGKS
jgi:cytochrome b561